MERSEEACSKLFCFCFGSLVACRQDFCEQNEWSKVPAGKQTETERWMKKCSCLHTILFSHRTGQEKLLGQCLIMFIFSPIIVSLFTRSHVISNSHFVFYTKGFFIYDLHTALFHTTRVHHVLSSKKYHIFCQCDSYTIFQVLWKAHFFYELRDENCSLPQICCLKINLLFY